MSGHVSATKQRNKVRHQIDAALIELWNIGSESHETAIAEDRLREAGFWVSKICVDFDTDTLAEMEVDQDARDLRDAIANDDGKRYSMSEVMEMMEGGE